MRRIPLTRPFLPRESRKKVLEVLDSGYLTEGPVTRELEQLFREHTGCGYVIAATSCTTGLEMALRALGIGPGDEVIVPDFTYPATAHAAMIVGATAVLVDVDRRTMLVDPEALREAVTPKTRAMIPVSLFGRPLDYPALEEIRRAHGLFMIEDAACSIGARYSGDPVGCIADISVFSLHPRKVVTTGEGGLITTDNAGWAEWMTSYKHFGIGPRPSPEGRPLFERPGTNYKLSDILAAVGLEQLRRIDEIAEERLRLAQAYRERLLGHPHIELPPVPEHGTHAWQTFSVLVDHRDDLIRSLQKRGIEAQIGTYALHMHRAFQESDLCRISGDMPGSRYAYQHCLALPLYGGMSNEDHNRVVNGLLAAIKEVS